MNVLITGGNGFIGSHLVERLLRHKYRITCLVRKTSDLKWIRNHSVDFVYGDISDFSSMLPIVSGVDYIYHLGGLLRTTKEKEFFHINYEGTKNLLEACRLQNPGLKRFVFISSQAAVGPGTDSTPLTEDAPPHPISAYGKSKRLAEQAVMEYSKFFPVTIIRPPVVYGPRDDDILEIFKYIKLGIKPLIGRKEKILSLIHVRDLVRGIHIAGEHANAENEIFFITNKNGYSWIEAEEIIARAMNKKTITLRVPEFVLDVAAKLSEQVAYIFKHAAILNRDKAIEMKQNYWLVDATKAERKLGFVAEISLEGGLKDTYQWYCQQGWL